jgi:hypothetical protein
MKGTIIWIRKMGLEYSDGKVETLIEAHTLMMNDMDMEK